MREIAYVDTEGGPLLLADVVSVRKWTGVDGSDYERACQFFDSQPLAEGGEIKIGNGAGLLWEMAGAGTAHIFKNNDQIVIMRAWLVDEKNENALSMLANERSLKKIDLGEIVISSGNLVILWAAENGSCILDEDLILGGRPTGDMAIESSGVIIKLEHKMFDCFHDQIKNEYGVARRCHIIPRKPVSK